MFPSDLRLFNKLPCPDRQNCKRQNCIFSHQLGLVEPPTVHIPVDLPKDTPKQSSAIASTSSHTQRSINAIPAKRSLSQQLIANPSNGSSSSEPPRKLQRTGPIRRPIATLMYVQTGVPLLRINPAQSIVPLPVRQAMLKSLYDHFVVLYEKILSTNPTLASEHALRQEEEVYKSSTKHTYRNAVISSIASLKRRPFPDNASHPSVGTEGEIAARADTRKKLAALRLTAAQLEPYMLTMEEMRRWGYVVEIPPGPGGTRPSEVGVVKTCERCGQAFKVKPKGEADECVFHWGKALTTKANGEKRRLYTCCERPADSEGCERGFHVFYETAPEDLHLRHPFSFTRPPFSSAADSTSPDSPSRDNSDEEVEGSSRTDTALDVVALDCEMVYTTGGMRVARVSVVDATGKEVFDELVRMDDGVEVIDFNTRFSGITPEAHASALLPLASIRRSLDTLISSETVVIGHALENDLKTLRMVHYRCVDTVALFPHSAGPPYRRALRALVKEFLGQTIQSGGGTVGHSSVEDSVATLDLVRWHVLNRPKPPPKTSTSTIVS
ncbi:Rexo1 protein [Laetiporus sulphureus 93-53]|uniref:Rexo1 protein n=1 Tax=Laetiporus sulphureus 93-53 TaxID=1314785 RepID=A0A165I1V2_9APHY|nr:Rexo1 protein [Laetiporus sulphureus 93-53]KZT12482.1 Rexo1 protein [Laetiporus sulphureus 93-53]